jgi:hypothetical protein
MYKQQINNKPEYFDSYIAKVPDIDLMDALSIFSAEMIHAEKRELSQIGHQVYAPGKWTIRDILQHMIDTERIFAYRALRIARNDQTPLPGFDENMFVKNAHASGRKLNDLITEFDIIRQSTILMFNSFNDEDLMREGFIFKSNISVLALGFTIAGHGIHHMNVMKERYYPLLSI